MSISGGSMGRVCDEWVSSPSIDGCMSIGVNDQCHRWCGSMVLSGWCVHGCVGVVTVMFVCMS